MLDILVYMPALDILGFEVDDMMAHCIEAAHTQNQVHFVFLQPTILGCSVQEPFFVNLVSVHTLTEIPTHVPTGILTGMPKGLPTDLPAVLSTGFLSGRPHNCLTTPVCLDLSSYSRHYYCTRL